MLPLRGAPPHVGVAKHTLLTHNGFEDDYLRYFSKKLGARSNRTNFVIFKSVSETYSSTNKRDKVWAYSSTQATLSSAKN